MLIKLRVKYKGFTIIELMVTVAVIAILAAIAIPNFLGLQEKAKRKVMSEVASSSKAELHNWMEAALKRQKGVVDVDGNGLIGPNESHFNLMTVPNSWIQAYAAKAGYTPLSPWDNTKMLFTVAPVNPVNPEQIVFSPFNAGRSIKIIAYGKAGIILYSDTVSVD
jgi:prepilin-type N-terminal cleavage/methylation domain-containing protein